MDYTHRPKAAWVEHGTAPLLGWLAACARRAWHLQKATWAAVAAGTLPEAEEAMAAGEQLAAAVQVVLESRAV